MSIAGAGTNTLALRLNHQPERGEEALGPLDRARVCLQLVGVLSDLGGNPSSARSLPFPLDPMVVLGSHLNSLTHR